MQKQKHRIDGGIRIISYRTELLCTENLKEVRRGPRVESGKWKWKVDRGRGRGTGRGKSKSDCGNLRVKCEENRRMRDQEIKRAE